MAAFIGWLPYSGGSDLPIRGGVGGGGGCHPDPSIRGRAVSKFFSLWAKIGGRPGPPGPSRRTSYSIYLLLGHQPGQVSDMQI